jgi:hypothetical protein
MKPDTPDTFPLNVQEMMSMFGLNPHEAVAYIGAHTIGKLGGFNFIKQVQMKKLFYTGCLKSIMPGRS